MAYAYPAATSACAVAANSTGPGRTNSVSGGSGAFATASSGAHALIAARDHRAPDLRRCPRAAAPPPCCRVSRRAVKSAVRTSTARDRTRVQIDPMGGFYQGLSGLYRLAQPAELQHGHQWSDRQQRVGEEGDESKRARKQGLLTRCAPPPAPNWMSGGPT